MDYYSQLCTGGYCGPMLYNSSKCYSISSVAAGEGGSAGGSNNPPNGNGPQPGAGGNGNNNPNPCVITRSNSTTTNAVKTNSFDDEGTDDGGYPNPNGNSGNNTINDPCTGYEVVLDTYND